MLKPALVCSLFPNVPPTIYFSTQDEKGELGSFTVQGEWPAHYQQAAVPMHSWELTSSGSSSPFLS